MTFKRDAIPYLEAQNRLISQIEELEGERISLYSSKGRVLSRDIVAPFDFPYFRRSGYDGFAITESDDHDYPIDLKVVAEVPCGETYEKTLKPGETVRIMTGAKVPRGADKIIMLEQSKVAEQPGHIRLVNTQPQSNITEIGAEFRLGDVLLKKGEKIGAGAISLLAAFGVTEFDVMKQPKVAIFSTGSELVSPFDSLPDGKIYNSNEALLRTLVEEFDCMICMQEALPDDYQLTVQKLTEASQVADLIITTGGVSVGDYDFMATIATQNEVLFNKVQMRPGSPTTAIRFQDTLIIALSGNPGACFTGYHLFALPVLAKLSGKTSPVRQVTGIMAEDYLKNNGYDRFLRGTYTEENGHYYVSLVGSDMSSSLGNLHQATCLFMIPRGQVGKRKGEEVLVWLLSSK
ncbi:molybdopterin molybdotransferase MoeA [Listeria fleischmannii]|uniref:Molybdopterin molybdenumtransferase n=1 Tax=Listeria fleischmannii TaxID=1069827 RepID=A0A841YAQ9_9LIST|nr:molybdopterin molybdotransferase MoeA [Listeria fleischmannii]EIA19583.1 molybdopterin biosynthesis protein MoeA [Listeria fleischmannii subsp. coloradonensis]MBC1397287.1 molybdopterin molybdotransferase MoeA [Listeria fleischmannii]MBC1425656.1 molybdopterin molybdotransferase MoeA [Listeria fleischmannii]STY35411.1 Molybdopterin molybdenumtransferase [Listeria fleischmannii subsp. coloradonensis]